MEKKDFKNKVMNIVRQSLDFSTIHSNIGACKCYSPIDYLRYVEGTMSPESIRSFEDHCRDCISCLKGVAESQEKSENEFLFKKTMGLLDKLEKNVISVVIEKTKDFLKVIKTTGEMLRTPAALPLRGESAVPKEEQAIRIIKEFSSPPVSIQVSFEKYKIDGEILLNISAFDRDCEEFIPDVEITLEGPNIKEEAICNEHGEATFVIKTPGKYRANLQADESHLATLNITITE